MLNLSLITYFETKIQKELRYYTTFLLAAGNRQFERHAWNILLEVTNGFQNTQQASISSPGEAQHQEHQEQTSEDGAKTTILDLQHRQEQLPSLAWKQFAGDILISLLALAGDETKVWTTLSNNKSGNGDQTQQNEDESVTVLSEPEARMSRYLLPHEKARCRNLFFAIIFSNDFIPSLSSRFDTLLPLLLSFSTAAPPKAINSTDNEEFEKQQLPLASSGTLRSIVSASITGLLLSWKFSSSTSSSAPSPLFSLLYSTVCEKAEMAPSDMMESGFRIAEAVASPPTAHGCISIIQHSSVDADQIQQPQYIWKPSLTSTEIVEYFKALLKQIGEDVLLRLCPSVNAVQNQQQQQQHLGIKSTHIRMLCASLFLIGRLLVLKQKTAITTSSGSTNISNTEEENAFSSVRSVLSLFALPRLVLVDREFLAPYFGALLRVGSSELLSEEEVLKSIHRLESLLVALQATPSMILSNTVEKSVTGIVVLIWEKVGQSLVTCALLGTTNNSHINTDVKRAARECLKLVLSSVAERILRKQHQSSSASNDDVVFLHSILFQPVIDVFLSCFVLLHNDEEQKKEDPLTRANAVLDDFIQLVYETTKSIVAVPTTTTRSTSFHQQQPNLRMMNNNNNTQHSSPVEVVSILIITELFKCAVVSQENRGKDSTSDHAHTMFVSLLLTKVTPKQMLAVSSSLSIQSSKQAKDIDKDKTGATTTASSSSTNIHQLEIIEQIFRFCRWTLRVFATGGENNNNNQSPMTSVTLDLLSALEIEAFVGKGSETTDAESLSETEVSSIEKLQKIITDLETEVAKLDCDVGIGEKQETCVRNLEVFKKGLEVVLMSSRNTCVDGTTTLSKENNPDESEEALLFDKYVTRIRKLFEEVRNLNERRMHSVLTVSLMDLCDQIREIPQLFTKIARRRRIASSSSAVEKNDNLQIVVKELWAKLLATEIFEKEVDYLVKNILLKSAQVGEAEQKINGASETTSASASSSSKSASLGRFRSTRTNLSSSSSLSRQNQNEAAMTNLPRRDDQVISATCSVLSLIALMRLDDNKNCFRSLLNQALKECATFAGDLSKKDKDDPTLAPVRKNLSVLSSFAATLLDVVIRVADEDSEGLTIKNLMFVGNDEAQTMTTDMSSCEKLCLEIVRAAPSHLPLNYQALRLCCINILGKCYQLAPLQCNFDTVESLIVGIFRSRSGGNQEENDHHELVVETEQILRLAAAALLSSVMQSVVISIFSSSSEKKKNNTTSKNEQIAILRRVRTFCSNVSQFRNPQIRLFEDEIREHGRIAEKHLKASCPEDVWGLIVAMESAETEDD